jgi:hypothetical protein
MLLGGCDEAAKENVRRLVLYQVVRQNSGWLFGVDFAKAARLQMSNNATQRRLLSYKTATRCPGYEVDMHVCLGYAGRRPTCVPRV